jgi:predicted kinase
MGTCLIIVTGAPAAGKTTVGRRIAEDFGLPFIHKDGIKETLFDTLGWGDREWSKKLGAASMALLYDFAEVHLMVGRPLVVESNFYPEFATSRFLRLKAKYVFKAVQIVCKANAVVLEQRWRERVRSSERHPGHVDQVLADELSFSELDDRFRALVLGGRVIHVDTTDLDTVDYLGLHRAIAVELEVVS